MSLKEKNAETIKAQKLHLQKQAMQINKVNDIEHASVDDLYELLSNKNRDYVFKLKKQLADQGKQTEEQVAILIDKLLPEIVVAQKKGVTAVNYYGKSPIEKAYELLHPVEKPKETSFTMLVLDNILLYLTCFLGMFGLIQMFSNQKNNSQNMGIITIMSVGIIFGILMAYYNRMLAMDKKDRPAVWKLIAYGIVMLVGVYVWIAIVSVVPIFRPINIVLPAVVNVGMGVIAFVLRMYLKKKYNIIDPLRAKQLSKYNK